MTKPKQINAAVLGATGYVGGQLMGLLAHHPQVAVTAATSVRHVGKRLSDVLPELGPAGDISLSAIDTGEIAARTDVVFCALPHGGSAGVVGDLIDAGCRVLDLSADSRFSDPQVYADAYGQPHPRPDLLNNAVYGLAEFNRDAIAGAGLVGVPGCYPTATLLALLPLLTGNFVKCAAGAIVDAKSGVSGAGREASTDNLYAEVAGGVRAYKAGVHRHQPEMRFHADALGGGDLELFFTPQVVPMSRGILANVYVRPADGIDSLAPVRSHLEKTYADVPFAQVLPEGQFPNTKHVTGTNRFQVAVTGSLDATPGARRLVTMCAIDNLMKGAAGQAVQCMNLMLGLEETAGLSTVGTVA